MNVLGISCFYHNSAACLVQNGKIVAAVEEERFNRQKYSPDFPYQAINFCLQQGNITVNELDYIVFYEKPYLKFYRVILDHIRNYPFSLRNFLRSLPSWLDENLILPIIVKKSLGYNREVLFIKHHLAHAASSYLISPFDRSAILTADGVGEWDTTCLGYGENNEIKIFQTISYPHSLGLLYTAVTTFLGFKALSGEGKVMGLASYGRPVYLNKLKEIVRIRNDGSYWIDSSYFGFIRGRKMFSKKFIKLFGKERSPDEKIDQRHCDIAASLQKLVEEIVIKICHYLYRLTNVDRLCLAGGLFLNCVLNHKILEETDFKEIFIQPAAGDAGGAVGAAFYIYNCLFKNPRNYILENVFLGPEYNDYEIEAVFKNSGLQYKKLNEDELVSYIAKKIFENKIVGWFQGRMEFGPRALGNRSILANPCYSKIKDLVNSKVKHRESFRPYAPAVLEEKAYDYFMLKQKSPFMLLACKVVPQKINKIPGVVHVDNTARVQTVSKKDNYRFWLLLKEFEKISGVPILLNTSFNLHGEPIVCSPQDAIEVFKKTEMDILVIGNYMLEKNEKC